MITRTALAAGLLVAALTPAADASTPDHAHPSFFTFEFWNDCRDRTYRVDAILTSGAPQQVSLWRQGYLVDQGWVSGRRPTQKLQDPDPLVVGYQTDYTVQYRPNDDALWEILAATYVLVDGCGAAA